MEGEHEFAPAATCASRQASHHALSLVVVESEEGVVCELITEGRFIAAVLELAGEGCRIAIAYPAGQQICNAFWPLFDCSGHLSL